MSNTAIQYIDWNPTASTLSTIAQANEICENLGRQGYDLTLRQLYYQFVSKDLIENTDRSYKNLGNIVNKARLSGRMSWDYIVDRTRNLEQLPSWNHPKDVLRSAMNGFKLDHWEGQLFYIEVWIEKDALVGVIERPCDELDVPYFSCRGYTSQSEMHSAAMRFARKEDHGIETAIIHLGDHDPSGIDMTDDIQRRLELFGAETHVDRVALTMDQIDELNPPPNFAKLSDARAQRYVELYGNQSWELDALEPAYLSDLVKQSVLGYRDERVFELVMGNERGYDEMLRALVDKPWDETVQWLGEAV